MVKMTITEALAEVKTIPQRVTKKREAIMRYLYRDSRLLDPLAKDDGPGSVAFIARERQAIKDLHDRHVRIRVAIQVANQNTMLDVDGVTRSVAYWLNWRKEVAEQAAATLTQIAQHLNMLRTQAAAKGVQAVPTDKAQPGAESQIMVNVDELALASEVEAHTTLLGRLDGKLQLHNATTSIEID